MKTNVYRMIEFSLLQKVRSSSNHITALPSMLPKKCVDWLSLGLNVSHCQSQDCAKNTTTTDFLTVAMDGRLEKEREENFAEFEDLSFKVEGYSSQPPCISNVGEVSQECRRK